LQRETATAEVLQVINSSPGDLTPVFEVMLEKAIRLCDGIQGTLWTLDGERAEVAASYGNTPEFVARLRERAVVGPPEGVRETVRGELLHIPNLVEHQLYRVGDPITRAAVELSGVRSLVGVPFVKDGAPVGALMIGRRELRPFTDRQIALLQNFAAQAVIAIENARLITDTREALERQTATAEVLGVINSSPGNLTPVFDAILEKAHALCGAAHGNLWTYDGELFHPVATRGNPRFTAWLRDHSSVPPAPDTVLERIVRGEDFLQIADAASDQGFCTSAYSREVIEVTGARTTLIISLRKDMALLGVIFAYRQEVRPFSDKQIALFKSFAAQAVIAIENARLLTETREALEQQTATAEVLQVINSSPGDLTPVFNAILEKAHTLCGATYGTLLLRDHDTFNALTTHGYPPALAERLRQGFRPGTDHPIRRLVDGDGFAHVADLEEIEDPTTRSVVQLAGVRTSLFVPLRRDGALLGVITAGRIEVCPFSDKQIALLQNFAAQAVIAMENARLLTETREALDQQTATAEVLGVINSSPGELAPVFDAMLERATRLCEAEYGILATYDGDRFVGVAAVGFPMDTARALSRLGHPPPNTVLGRLERTKQTVQMADIAQEPSFAAVFDINPWLRRVHTALSVPLLREGELIGAFSMFREEVRPFTDKQTALLQNFAAQAVIAMENARLMTETREALEQQIATAEVLQVINSSPGDLAPVFDAILERAHTLCGTTMGGLATFDGGQFRFVAAHGVPDFIEYSVRPSPDGKAPLEQLTRGEPLIHLADALAVDAYREHPGFKSFIDRRGTRTFLLVSLRKDGVLLGAIGAYRQEVLPFTDKQIALLQNSLRRRSSPSRTHGFWTNCVNAPIKSRS
jgi:GAF domain-containing protein